jgi:beta-galactosidase
MHRAGLRVVRLAEFAWNRLEPREGRYDFSWLDEAMALLGRRGIRVVLCTPSAAPTAWQIAQWPDLLPVQADGHVWPFGIRRHYCMRHEGYRDACRRIAGAMADRFGRNRQVLGWQIDNEWGGTGTWSMCYCPRCVREWREWLRRRYGTPAALNAAWGTAFWAQEYFDWDQVVAPVEPVQMHNPSLYLDWRRFSSEGVAQFQQVQVDALRPRVRNQWISTNFMGTFKELNYEALAAPLDLAGWDNYPIGAAGPVRAALAHARTRGLKQRNFWVFEQQSGPSGWNTMSRAPKPGELRLWTWQSVGAGADAVLYFRWRVCRSGTEQYWHGILGHDGRTNRRYAEVRETAAEFQRLSKAIDGTEVRAPAALWHLYDAHWVVDFQPGCDGMDLWAEARRWAEALARRGLMYDVVGERADLARYRLLVCPHAVILRPDHAEALRRFAAGGGTVVLTARSGERTWSNLITPDPRPGLLRKLAGVRVTEYDMVTPPRRGQIEMADTGRLYDAFGWSDVLAPEGARTVAAYAADFYAGRPAATVNRVGKGRVYYVGTSAEGAFYDDLAARLAEELRLPMLPALPADCEVLERRGNGRRLLFALNHSGDPRTVDVAARGRDLLSGKTVGPKVDLRPYGVRVIRTSEISDWRFQI